MLRFIRQGQRWIVITLVAAVGAVFVLFFGPWDFTQTAGSEAVPIEVDGVQYRREDVERVRENLERYYRDQLGDGYDALSDQIQLADRAVRQLVDRAILAGEAKRMGLTASDAEVERMIRQQFSNFRDEDGNLSEEQARNYVIYEWGSVRRFKEEVRTDIALRKLGRLLIGAAGASRAEALDALRYRGEEVRIAYVSLDPDAPPEGLDVDPQAVEEFARNESERIAAYYEENRSRWDQPERIRLRHVHLVLDVVEDEEAVRAAAEAARARIAAGEDMGAVAREVSEDASRETGGDLGLLPRSDVARVLLDAVEGLEPGELSPVVRGEEGFHIVRVEEVRPAETKSLEEVAPRIAEELYRKEQAAEWAANTADALQKAIASGRSLEEAARALRLNIERTGFFPRRPDGFIAGLGDSLEIQSAVFALSEAEPTWPHPFTVGDRTVFVQFLERRTPDPAELEAQVAEEQARLVEVAQQRAEQIWLAERRSQLQAQGRIHVDPSAVE